MNGLLGIGLLAALVQACTLVETKTCTTVGCASMITLAEVPAGVDRSAPERIAVRFCRNGECFTSNVARNSADPETLRCTTSNAPARTFAIGCTIAAGTFRASIQSLDPAQLADGDVFRIMVDDASGRVFDTGDRTVTHTVSQPNGPDCDPTCKSATL